MARIQGPQEFGAKLCQVLGLDPEKTRRVVLVYDVKDAVRIYVQQYLFSEEVDPVLTALVEYVEEVAIADDGTVQVKRQVKE